MLVEQLGGRGAGVEGEATQQSGADGGGELLEVSDRQARGPGRMRRLGPEAVVVVVGEVVEAVGVGAQLLRRTGQGGGDAGAQVLLEGRQDRAADPDAGVAGVGVVRVVPGVQASSIS